MTRSYRSSSRLAEHMSVQLQDPDCQIQTHTESPLWTAIFSAVQEPVWRAVGQTAGIAVTEAILRELGSWA